MSSDKIVYVEKTVRVQKDLAHLVDEFEWFVNAGYSPIYLDYAVDPTPRYGSGAPPNTDMTGVLERIGKVRCW